MEERPSILRWLVPGLPVAWKLWPWTVGVVLYCLGAAIVLRWFKAPFSDWGAEAATITGLILAVLLTFRNNAAYDRWWEGRKLWGQLTNDTRNLAIKVEMYVQATVEERQLLRDLLAGFAFALKRHLRGKADLQSVPGFANESAQPAHVPLYLAERVVQQLAQWRQDGRMDGYSALMLDPHARGLLDVCGGCERIRNTPFPVSYRTLLRHCIAIYVLVAPWPLVHELGLWGVPIIGVATYFLLGIELAAECVEEPFGREDEDLNLDQYYATIHNNLNEALELDDIPPAPPSILQENLRQISAGTGSSEGR